jgi:glycosyltransferase involved in cell wall biosynthesis
MFKLDVPPAAYRDPWDIPLEDRLRSLARGQQRVAYFCEYPDSSSFRYRVYNMIQALEGANSGISAAYFGYDEFDVWDRAIDMADVLVVCRARYNSRLNCALDRARSKGKPIFYDIDDLVFNPRYVHLIMNALDQEVLPSEAWDKWFAYTGRLGAALDLCDRAITTNAYLAARIQEFCGKPVSVIPNFMNREQLEISAQIYRQKVNSGFARNDQVHLGYFSGSPTHNKDFEIMYDALVDLFERDPRIVLRVVGYMHLQGPIQNYRSRIEFYPLQDFVNLQRLVGEVEINLVPLQDNVFTNCKSELKYFEAGIGGTVTVASPTFTYQNAIRDGKNGFLARDYEWYEKIAALIATMDEYTAIACEAQFYSSRKFSWQEQAGITRSILFSDFPF